MEGARARLKKLLGSVSRREGHVWAITLREGGRVIGDCGVAPHDRHGRGELGYLLHPAFWNKGLATEALGAVVGWATREREPRLDHLFADHFPKNPASGRVLEKLGFVREGVLRGFVLKEGARLDVVRMVGCVRNDRGGLRSAWWMSAGRR